MKRLKLSFVFLVFLMAPALAVAALNFPTLSGRVVDDAHVLSPTAVQSLDQTLAAYEQSTKNQLVVVTVKSLQGTSIEDYGYQLGRSWGIGQKGKDNGVMLLVAPKEHKVRIEVGYGLEGVLTDAMCSQIIQGVILPDFRAGRMEKGIIDGVQAIMGGQPVPVIQNIPQQPRLSLKDYFWLTVFLLLIIGKCIVYFSPRFYLRHPFLSMIFLMSSGSSSSGGSGPGGFSFSGGGGSFGGGGASGGW